MNGSRVFASFDYDREMVLVVERKNNEGQPEAIAIGRLSKLRGGGNEAELAVLWTTATRARLGHGTVPATGIRGARRKLKRVVSTILTENREMRAICQRLGFRMKSDLEDGNDKG